MWLGSTLKIPELQSLRQKLICYQAGQYQPTAEDQLALGQQSLLPEEEDRINFQLIAQADSASLELKGLLCPFRLHDAYAIDLTLFSPTPITLGQLNQLNPQGLLLPPHIQASLGQTLLFYAEVDALEKDDRSIADACLAQLLQNQVMPEFLAEGKLLGSSIFEYGSLVRDPAQQYHILVWLNHNQLAPEVDEVSERLLYLLNSRHKILYAYDQSRWCDRQAKQLYSDLELNIVQRFNQIARSPDHLQQFQTLLRNQLPQTAFQYAQYLRDLSDHETTINTNLQNYRQQLAKLARLPGCDLTFLQDFLDLAENKYLKQIQVNQSYLTPGQALFQQLTETIRGLAELEQTESDRCLERTVQVLGVGLATGTIVGAGYSYTEKPFKPPFSTNTIHPFVAYLLWSFTAAFIAGVIAYWLTQLNLLVWWSNLRNRGQDEKTFEE
ncbi:hypothetical protein [Halomicronema hongdechloris]|uniref:hypothetical protein n=1 Tax=Halomicronema hongdechloris TaxID=1209493 RepID=UPI0009BB8DFB|nr:hypothetical protein [Halomicronema hongdechloris]